MRLRISSYQRNGANPQQASFKTSLLSAVIQTGRAYSGLSPPLVLTFQNRTAKPQNPAPKAEKESFPMDQSEASKLEQKRLEQETNYYKHRMEIAGSESYKAFSKAAQSEGMSNLENIMSAFADHGGGQVDPNNFRGFVKELKTRKPELFDDASNLTQRMNKIIRQRSGHTPSPSVAQETPKQPSAPGSKPDLSSRMNSLIRRKAYED